MSDKKAARPAEITRKESAALTAVQEKTKTPPFRFKNDPGQKLARSKTGQIACTTKPGQITAILIVLTYIFLYFTRKNTHAYYGKFTRPEILPNSGRAKLPPAATRPKSASEKNSPGIAPCTSLAEDPGPLRLQLSGAS